MSEENKIKPINQVKAEAVMEFVNHMIGAFESGFVDKNNPTLSEIYRCAQNHVLDNYLTETKNIIELWGVDVATDCGLSIKPITIGDEL